ncbi:MAG: histidine--tRNA ligase family protein [Phycisphaerales bacterium]|nr:histidine--tRNA ligase family protein [Phycisphaerales bacterium]
MSQKKINAPKGTRDLYPEDLLRQQYITNAWRDAAIRCGFDEIAGPTFETTELYAVKSGEGILGELFQAFSGKSPKEVERVKETGQAEFALRPEFTPTLARMYAARAKELPQPCKWFTAGPYFRAERPQRGRLREFLQWNVDAIGMPADDNSTENRARMDAEVIECMVRMFEDLGLIADALTIKLNDRNAMAAFFASLGVTGDQLEDAFNLLDRQAKLPTDALRTQAQDANLPEPFIAFLTKADPSTLPDLDASDLDSVCSVCSVVEIDRWIARDHTIARGLAYYTGTVFEAIAEGERAVAGGGRYDNLIELFGGPPTPACGFGMGDVVLGNLLDDKGLMPSGAELMDAVSRPQASIRPVAFVVPNGDEANEPLVHSLVANLRRGIESEPWKSRDDRKPWDSDRYSVAPVHARVSYKSTRNIKKLRSDAERQHARYFVEIHADNKVELTDMDRRESLTSDTHGSFSVDPAAPNYVGAAIAARL